MTQTVYQRTDAEVVDDLRGMLAEIQGALRVLLEDARSAEPYSVAQRAYVLKRTYDRIGTVLEAAHRDLAANRRRYSV